MMKTGSILGNMVHTAVLTPSHLSRSFCKFSFGYRHLSIKLQATQCTRHREVIWLKSNAIVHEMLYQGQEWASHKTATNLHTKKCAARLYNGGWAQYACHLLLVILSGNVNLKWHIRYVLQWCCDVQWCSKCSDRQGFVAINIVDLSADILCCWCRCWIEVVLSGRLGLQFQLVKVHDHIRARLSITWLSPGCRSVNTLSASLARASLPNQQLLIRKVYAFQRS